MIRWNQKKLETCLAYWQKVLHLQDWEIEIGFIREREIRKSFPMGAGGFVLYDTTMQRASISILDPVDDEEGLDDFLSGFSDKELTIIHELLHLHFIKINEGEDSDKVVVEQVINTMAKALLSFHRVIVE